MKLWETDEDKELWRCWVQIEYSQQRWNNVQDSQLNNCMSSWRWHTV